MWSVKYGPKSSADLAVHKKKLDELRQWIKQQSLVPGLLIIHGPSGCGKTTSARIECQEAGIELVEWSNPISTYPFNKSDDVYDSYERFKTVDNQMTQFWDFLLKSSRYCEITLDHDDSSSFAMKERLSQAFDTTDAQPETEKLQQIILLKDLPNVVLMQPKELGSILERYFSSPSCQSSLILILTDSEEGKNDFLRHFKVPPSIQTTSIKFNPTALTLLVKALNRIVTAHNKSASRKTQSSAFRLSSEQIQQLATEAQGDIRYAVNQLEWAHRDQKYISRGVKPVLSRKRSQSSSTPPSSQNQESKDGANSSRRDVSLGLLHIVGKILHFKGDLDARATSVAQNTYDKASSSLSSSTLTLFLQQNYLQFRSSIEKGSATIDILSQCDSLLGHNFESVATMEPYAWWASSLGVMREAEVVGMSSGWCPVRKAPYSGIITHAAVKLANFKRNCVGFTWNYPTDILVTELVPWAAKLGHIHAKELGVFKDVQTEKQFIEIDEIEMEEEREMSTHVPKTEIVEPVNEEEEDFIIEDYDDLEKMGAK